MGGDRPFTSKIIGEIVMETLARYPTPVAYGAASPSGLTRTSRRRRLTTSSSGRATQAEAFQGEIERQGEVEATPDRAGYGPLALSLGRAGSAMYCTEPRGSFVSSVRNRRIVVRGPFKK